MLVSLDFPDKPSTLFFPAQLPCLTTVGFTIAHSSAENSNLEKTHTRFRDDAALLLVTVEVKGNQWEGCLSVGRSSGRIVKVCTQPISEHLRPGRVNHTYNFITIQYFIEYHTQVALL